MRFHKIVIREIERNRSLKVFKLFAESIGEAGETAAVHPQGVILLFNVRGCNQIHIRLAANRFLFNLHNFRRTIPDCRWCSRITKMGTPQAGILTLVIRMVALPGALFTCHQPFLQTKCVGSVEDRNRCGFADCCVFVQPERKCSGKCPADPGESDDR